MSNYNKVNDFAAKDAINAPVVGTEFQQEFDAIQTAVNSKADSDDTILTGTPVTPTPDGGTTNQIVNVEYVTEYTYDKENTVSSNLAFPAPQSQINSLQTNIIKDTFDQKSSVRFSSGTSISIFTNNIERVAVNSSGLTATAITSQGTTTISNGQLVLNGTGRVQGVDTVSAGTDAANKNYVDRLQNINEVGSMVFALSDVRVAYGGTVSGGSLRPAGLVAGSSALFIQFNTTLPGTWRCLGYADRDNEEMATLFVRIS